MVSKNSGDVEKIFIDKSLCGKITDKINAGWFIAILYLFLSCLFHMNSVFCIVGIWAEDFMLLSLCDKPKLCCISFSRNLPTDFRRLEKLAALDIKVTFIDLPGQSGRRLNRCLSLNTTKEMVKVFFSLGLKSSIFCEV